MFSLQVSFFRESQPFSSVTQRWLFSGVRCAFEGTPDVFGVSSPRKLKAKPLIIKSTPWPLSDVLDILIFRRHRQCQIFYICPLLPHWTNNFVWKRSRWVHGFCRRDLPVWMFFASWKINESRSLLLVRFCCASFKVKPTHFAFIFVVVGWMKVRLSLSSYIYYSGFKRFFFTSLNILWQKKVSAGNFEVKRSCFSVWLEILVCAYVYS